VTDTKPPIGVPRVYTTNELPVLYPGEQASVEIAVPEISRAAEPGGVEGVVVGWIVEPAPGWPARWRRLVYRLVGRWVSRGAPTLEVTACRVWRRERDDE
jgi:hypothetical protein